MYTRSTSTSAGRLHAQTKLPCCRYTQQDTSATGDEPVALEDDTFLLWEVNTFSELNKPVLGYNRPARLINELLSYLVWTGFMSSSMCTYSAQRRRSRLSRVDLCPPPPPLPVPLAAAPAASRAILRLYRCPNHRHDGAPFLHWSEFCTRIQRHSGKHVEGVV